MAGPGDLSATPGSNTTIGGINIGENCPAENVNDALRYMAAMVRQTWDAAQSAGGGDGGAEYVTKANGVFSNQPSVQNRGAVLHHASSGNGSGRVFVQAIGGTPPPMSNGDILIEY